MNNPGVRAADEFALIDSPGDNPPRAAAVVLPRARHTPGAAQHAGPDEAGVANDPDAATITHRIDRDDAERSWALETLARWIGCIARPARADERPDVYVGGDRSAARHARIWIDPDEWQPRDNLRLAFDAVRALDKAEAADAVASPFARPASECDGGRAATNHAATLGFDPLSAAAALLQCRDAAESDARDEHDRLPDDHTAVVRAGLSNRPVCHVWARLLAGSLARRGWIHRPRPVWPGGKRWAAVLTHDVDLPQRDDADGRLRLARALRAAGRPFAALRQAAAAGLAEARTRFGLRDPSWAFDEWTAFERSLGFRSTWAFLSSTVGAPGASPRDARYRVEDPRYRQLLADMTRDGFEIALHAGYDAAHVDGAVAREVHALNRAVPDDVRGVRHHFWRIDAADPLDTWRRHAAAGLSYDMSLSLLHRAGFRAGAAMPFRPFDRQTGAPAGIWVIPSTMMDAAVCRGRSQAAAIEAALGHLETCRRHGVCAVLNWHARTWRQSRDCRGFGATARAVWRWLSEQDDVWVTSARELVRHVAGV